jgi:glyoxylase-like metal-dependent hydrolase (beta-lactamase superfamily II)
MEVAPQVYQIGIWGMNVALIAEEELTLIDTGIRGSSGRVLSFIRRLGRSPSELSMIILTHYHFDHAGAVAELKRVTGARVAVHKADAPYVSRELAVLKQAKRFQRIATTFLSEGAKLDILLEDGDELSPLGGLRVVHTPGHTPGSISLFSPERRLVIVGDAINHWWGRGLSAPMFSLDMAQAKQSIKRLAELDFDILCPGHGKAVTEGASAKVRELANNI